MNDLIIVDGYNIIFKDPDYQKIKDASLELARVRLIEDLANYQAYTGNDVKIVFDAANQDFQGERKAKVLGVEIIFTKKGQSADSCIERLAFRTNADRTVIVATSDYSLQRVVFGKGIYRRTPAELLSEIGEVKEEWRVHAKDAKPFFLEDRLDEQVREKLRKLILEEPEEMDGAGR